MSLAEIDTTRMSDLLKMLEKGLEPQTLGYESGGWVAKEAVAAALGRKEAPGG